MKRRINYNILEELWIRCYLGDKHPTLNGECMPWKGCKDDLYDPVLSEGYVRKGIWFDNDDVYIGI